MTDARAMNFRAEFGANEGEKGRYDASRYFTADTDEI